MNINHNRARVKRKRLVETDRLAHGGLDVERLDVLPVLLEQGDQEVDSYELRIINLIL